MIYFFEAEGLGLVKIGFTENAVGDRLRQIARVSPARLHCLGVMQGGSTIESALHLQFVDLLDHGEWYRLAPELAEFIEKNTAPFILKAPKRRRTGRQNYNYSTIYFVCTNEFRDWVYLYADIRKAHIGRLVYEGLQSSAKRLGVPGPPSPPKRWLIRHDCVEMLRRRNGGLGLSVKAYLKRWIMQHARLREMKMAPMIREAIMISAQDKGFPIPPPSPPPPPPRRRRRRKNAENPGI